MERQTAGESLDDVESEKDPAFKLYWKFSDKVLTDPKRQEEQKPSCRIRAWALTQPAQMGFAALAESV